MNLAFISHVPLARAPFRIKVTIALAFATAESILLCNLSKFLLIVTQNNDKVSAEKAVAC